MKHNISKLGLVLRGAAMGVAEIIPGVSGGTIAFITGIYEDLIDTIKSVGPEAFEGFKSGGVKGLWESVNGGFISFVLVGMVLGVVTGVFGVTYLMETFPEPLWAFFFGLILASAAYMAKQIDGFGIKEIVAIIIGALVAYFITTITPAEGSLSLPYVFLSGMIAISAFILPGISGSFILLIMGMYGLIIPLIKDILHFDLSGLVTVVVFALGCLTGLIVFSRVLSWLFEHYKQLTFAVLTGFLIGALNKVWPWRNITRIFDKTTNKIVDIANAAKLKSIDLEEAKIINEANVLPAQYWGEHMYIIPAILCFVLGVAVVFLLEKLDNRA